MTRLAPWGGLFLALAASTAPAQETQGFSTSNLQAKYASYTEPAIDEAVPKSSFTFENVAAVATVRTFIPLRRTVTLSATSITSFNLCEMKITLRPSSAMCRRVVKSDVDSCGVSTAVGSSRIRIPASR